MGTTITRIIQLMGYNFMLLYAVHNIIFQHPVALVNGLIYRGRIGGATSCRALTTLQLFFLQMLPLRHVSAL
jgi:hypothetical protein